MTWLSRIGKDSYIYLMLAVNAYTNKYIDDLRADLQMIANSFKCSELHDFQAYDLVGSYLFVIKDGAVSEKGGFVQWET